MIFQIYSVRDALSGFMTPVIEQNDAIAMRNFALACDRSRSSNSLMVFRPRDFSFYRIGTFDSDSGLIVPVTPPDLVCDGLSVGGKSDA
ncbi:nonstructural protein [Sigmofec virus UA08Rod_5707]|uniref:Nonstructural protein n=1 Tax=Sigmofec virus UA08Rod_5707 TaxID=2929437 RepID=A0A976N157_9VIRU|nr:nonstructural protein [Sigmofec virus UA08Rod_5707]